MDIKDAKGNRVGKVAGKSAVLFGDEINNIFIHGQDFELVVKLNSGDIVTITSENGVLNYESDKTEKTNSEGGSEQNDSNGESRDSGGETDGGKADGGKDTSKQKLPDRPTSWIKGK